MCNAYNEHVILQDNDKVMKVLGFHPLEVSLNRDKFNESFRKETQLSVQFSLQLKHGS